MYVAILYWTREDDLYLNMAGFGRKVFCLVLTVYWSIKVYDHNLEITNRLIFMVIFMI